MTASRSLKKCYMSLMIAEFLKDYLSIIIFLIVALGLSCAFVLMIFILAPNNPDPEKLSSYECGFEPFTDSRMEFDVKFYLVAILFIIFVFKGYMSLFI